MRIEQLSPRLAALAEEVETHLAGHVERLPVDLNAGQLAYTVAPEALLDVCRTLRDHASLRFDMLMDLAGVDYLGGGATGEQA